MARRASGEYGCERSRSSNLRAASSNLPLFIRASASAYIFSGGSELRMLVASDEDAQPASVSMAPPMAHQRMAAAHCGVLRIECRTPQPAVLLPCVARSLSHPVAPDRIGLQAADR